MGQVSVTMNGRTFRLRCDDGEEERLLSVADHVRGHVDRLIGQHGQIGDERLLLMAAILITDEFFEQRDRMGMAPAVPTAPTARSPIGVPGPASSITTPVDFSARPANLAPQPQPFGPAPSPRQPPPTSAAAPPMDQVRPAPEPQHAAPPGERRPIDQLDATALMKGLGQKGRG